MFSLKRILEEKFRGKAVHGAWMISWKWEWKKNAPKLTKTKYVNSESKCKWD